MAFQIKDFSSIVAGMVNHARANQDTLTDFSVGSVARTLLEAPAIELDELYQQYFNGIMDAIPTSIYTTFGITPYGATSAQGAFTITFGGPVVQAFTIPAGTVFPVTATGAQFLSVADVVVPVGATEATVTVAAAVAGAAGNVAAGALGAPSNFSLPAGATWSSAAMQGGTDGESPSAMKARFGSLIASLSRGTVDSIIYAVSTTVLYSPSGALLEYVSRVGMQEYPGYFVVYVYGVNAAPSAALLALVQQVIDGYIDPATGLKVPGYRAAGVGGSAEAMTVQAVDVGLQISMLPGYTYDPVATYNAIETALAPVISGVISGGVLEVDSLSAAALSVAGVQTAIPANTSNVPCPNSSVLQLGSLTVTQL